MSTENFRAAMRRFPTGVTIITTVLDGVLHGFTANAFTSVSIDPPTVLICVNRGSSSHPLISQAQVFCVNFLALDQIDVAKRFADNTNRAGRFEGLATSVNVTGAPAIDGALAFVDCKLTEEYSAGTHTLFLGEVVASGATGGKPLGYFDADYRDFSMEIGPHHAASPEPAS